MRLAPPKSDCLDYPFIQVCRYLAAILVVLDHALLDFYSIKGVVDDTQIELAWRMGNFGVYIFFIISGFVITHGAWNKFGTLRPIDFLLRRVIRIYPLYCLITAVYLVKLATKNVDFDFSNVFFSFLLIPYGCVHAECGRPILQLGWTLQFEMIFYVLFSLGLLFRRGIAISFLVVTLIVVALLGWQFELKTLPYSFYFNPIVVYFLAGMLMAVFIRTGFYEKMGPLFLLLNERYYLLGIVCLVFFSSILLYIASAGEVFLAFALSVLIVFVCLRSSFGAPEKPGIGGRFLGWFLYFGAASYSLYLTHFFALYFVAFVFRRIGIDSFSIYFSVAILFSTGLACLCYRFIERPISVFILGKYKWLQSNKN